MNRKAQLVLALLLTGGALARLGYVIAAECGTDGNTYWTATTAQAGTRQAFSTNHLLHWSSGTTFSTHHVDGQSITNRDFVTIALGRPVAVSQSAGRGTVVVVAGSDGLVYALNPTNASTAWTRSLRRVTCSTDSITATPVVQLFDASDAAYQSVMTNQEDLVMVGTAFACGSTTLNRVAALRADTGAIKWLHNSTGTYPLDRITGLVLDVTRNLVFVAADETGPASSQSTLFALNTLNGARVWAADLGAIESAPLLANGWLYVVTRVGILYKINPASGAVLWSETIPTGFGGQVTLDMAADEERSFLFVTDTVGRLYGMFDAGCSVVPMWSTDIAGRMVRSSPLSASATGKVYAGTGDGRVYQLNAITGSADSFATIQAGSPTTDLLIRNENGTPNRLHATAGTSLKRLCIPWLADGTDKEIVGGGKAPKALDDPCGTNSITVTGDLQRFTNLVGQTMTRSFTVSTQQTCALALALLSGNVPYGLVITNGPSDCGGVWPATSFSRIIVSNELFNFSLALRSEAPGTYACPIRINGQTVAWFTNVVLPNLPVVQATPAAVEEGNAGTNLLPVTVTLNMTSAVPVFVGYVIAAGTTTAGVDFVPSDGVLTFNPGELSHTVNVPVLGDTEPELDETVLVQLSSSPGGLLLQSNFTMTILNDDAPVTVTVSEAEVVEGDEFGTVLTLAVSLNHPSPDLVSVAYATSNGTAQAGVDFEAAGGVVTFNPGDTNAALELFLLGDMVVEPDESFVLHLFNPTNAVIENTTVLLTLLNDDTNRPPFVSLAMADQFAPTWTEWVFTFDPDTFGDLDPDTVLSYSASNLPPGLAFDGPSRTFSGTNSGTADWLITVTATDNGVPPESVSDTFLLRVGGAPPVYDVREVHRFSNGAGEAQHPCRGVSVGTDGVLYGTTLDGGSASKGTVFKVNPDGSGFGVLHHFTGGVSSGATPHAALLEGSDGKLYGTTGEGGSNSFGVVFRLNKDGTGHEILHHFRGLLAPGGQDGRLPLSKLIEASDGRLYGTTHHGGSNDFGCIYSLNKDGSGFALTYQWPIGAGLAGHPESEVLEASDGMLYGTLRHNGPEDRGVLYRVSKSGAGYTLLRHFGLGETNGAHPWAGVIEGADGALYGTTQFGGVLSQAGNSGAGSVYRIQKDGTGFTLLHSFLGLQTNPALTDGNGPFAALVRLADGYLYGTTAGGGTGACPGTVFRLREDGTGYARLFDFGCGKLGRNAFYLNFGGVAPGPDGVLYFASPEGGTNSTGNLMALSPTNTPPYLANAIPDTNSLYGAHFTFTLATDTFNDPDAGQALSYLASNLPPGISFDGPTRTFSGTNTDVGEWLVTVTATDDGTPPLATEATFLFSVGKAPLLVIVGSTNRPYGQFNPWFTPTYSGFVLGDDEFVLDSPPFASSIADGSSPVGTYPITAAFGFDDHYEFISVDGTLTVTPVPLTVLAGNICRGVGEPNPPLPGVLLGATSWDKFTHSLSVTCSTPATAASPVGVYPVIPILNDPDQRATNYVVSYVTGSVQVVSAPVNIEIVRHFGFTNLMGHNFHGPLVEGSNGVAFGVTFRGGLLVDDDFFDRKGVLFRVNLDGSGYQVLHFFQDGPADGATPSGTLLLASDGWLYGTTAAGGSNAAGTVFRLRQDGSDYAVIRNDFGTGSAPRSLVEGTNGLLYFTAGGGASFAGMVLSMAKDGSDLALVRELSAETDGYNPEHLVVGGDGVLYGATQGGGPGFGGTFFRLNTDGTGFAVIKALDFGTSGASGLIEGSDGFLYATLIYGGPNNQGAVIRLARDGSSDVFLHGFNDGPTDGTQPFGGVVEGTNGVLYGTTRGGGNESHGTVFQLNKDGTGYQVLWHFTPQTNSVGTPVGGVLAASDGRLYGASLSDGGLAIRAVVWGLNTDGSQFSELHEFHETGGDGWQPLGPLMLGLDDRLYGVTYYAGPGAMAQGTVFALSRDGSGYEVLWTFSSELNFPDGAGARFPQHGVVQGADGRLYGVTQQGGTNFAGTIFALNTNGSGFTVLHHFDNSTFERGLLSGGLTVGSNGTLFGVSGGDSYSPGTVFKLNPDGSDFAILRQFTNGPTDGFGPGGRLLLGSDGALYGTTVAGGADGEGLIFKLDQDGSGYTVLHEFNGIDGALCLAGLMEASDGKLYGITYGGGSWEQGVIFRLNRDGSGFAVIESLSPANGGGSRFPLVEGADGALYGAGDGFSASSEGMIFRVSKEGGDFCMLRRFDRSIGNARNPYSPLLRAPDGTLFGLTLNGGLSGFGTLFKVSAPGNQPPALANAFPNQSATYGTPFSFTFAADTFSDPDAGQSLSYAASNVPPGITFDGPTRTFSGLPSVTGNFAVSVTATDDGVPPASVPATFEIVVAPALLTVTASNATRAFGQPNPILTGSLEGVVNSDDITAGFATDALLDSPPGAYPINVSLNDPNSRLTHYLVTTNAGVLTIQCASSLTVTSLADAGPGTLREALAVACNGATIAFAVTGTMVLTSGDLPVERSVNIIGPGATNLTISGGNAWRAFNVTTGDVFISGLTVADGSDSAAFLTGAGLRNNAHLTLLDCRFTANTSEAAGGAIFNRPDGTLVIDRCLFDGNRALGAYQGGGVGGAIANQGVLRVTNSTFSGNSAGFSAGALRNAGEMSLASCTFTHNTASECTDCEGVPAVIVHVGTFAELHNSIVAGNTNAVGPHRDVSGAFDSGDYNLIEQPAGFAVDGTNNRVGLAPLLGPLADHGGQTFTHLPLAGSPAFDAGDPGNCPATDQRGVARPLGGRCDIGAVEAENALTPPVLRIDMFTPALVTVSWHPATPGFILETTVSLSPPAWTNAPSGATNPVTLPVEPAGRFFRLRR